MKRNTAVGAALLGLGLGGLSAALFPWLDLSWPLVALLVGVMLWRQAGTLPLRIMLGTVALSWAFSAANLTSERISVPEVGGVNVTEDSRVLTTLTATKKQLAQWQSAERFNVVNAVGTVSIESGELGAEVRYRSNRRRATAPQTLRAVFDETTRTLTLTGIDLESSERERRGLSADIVLNVPERATVDVLTEVADITVKGVGDTTLKTTVGNLLAETIKGNLSATSEAGDIRVHNSEGRVDVYSNVGNLSLSFDDLVKAAIDARTRVGDISLSLPEASNVKLHALSALRSFSGDLERVKPNESRLLLGDESIDITLQTDAGEVKVKTY